MPSIATNRRVDRAELEAFIRPRHCGVLLTTRADSWPQSSLVTVGLGHKGDILVAIESNDEIWIDRRLIDPRALRANIERLHAENPKGSVVIQADRKSTNKMLVTVMDAARQAGVYNISIADN